jgi:hypothetical protein
MGKTCLQQLMAYCKLETLFSSKIHFVSLSCITIGSNASPLGPWSFSSPGQLSINCR